MSSLQWDGKNWTSPLHKRKSLILRLRREDGPKAQHHCAPSQCWCHSTDSKSLLSARTWHLDGIWRDSSLKSFETHSRDLSQIWGPTSWAQSSNIFCQFFSRSAQVQVCEKKLSSLQLFFCVFQTTWPWIRPDSQTPLQPSDHDKSSTMPSYAPRCLRGEHSRVVPGVGKPGMAPKLHSSVVQWWWVCSYLKSWKKNAISWYLLE